MSSSPSGPIPAWLLLMGTLGAIIGFCWSHSDYVAASSLAAVAITGLWGYYIGALRMVGMWGALVAGSLGAVAGGQWLEPHLSEAFRLSPQTTHWLSMGAAGVGIALAISIGVRILGWHLFREHPHLEFGNRLVGFGIGGAQGAAAVLLLLNGFLLLEPQARARLNEARQGNRSSMATIVAARVVEIADQTRRSTLGPLIQKYNPLEHIPQLRDLQRTVTAASDPKKVQRALHSRRVQQLRNRPEVQTALSTLERDPAFRRMAESGQPLDQAGLSSLLNHPEITKLLSQPELLRELQAALQEQ